MSDSTAFSCGLVLLIFTRVVTAAMPAEILLRPAAEPEAVTQQEVIRWQHIYWRQFRPIRRYWRVVSRTIGSGRLDRLPAACRAFSEQLHALDREILLDVDEPVIRIHLSDALRWLDGADERCRRSHLFDLVYHLSEARAALIEVDQQLRRYRKDDSVTPE